MSRFKDNVGNVIDVPDALDGMYAVRPEFTLVEVPLSEDEAEAEADLLKGEALNAALIEAGLPTMGKADEKRARLAEHLADPSSVEADDVTNETKDNTDG